MLIYALLALGLNVVVGFAGLLDLGYVAFFGFGAYTYAFLSRHALGQGPRLHPPLGCPVLDPRRGARLRLARAPPRLVVAAAARRLPRDRDALLRPGVRRLHQRRRTRSRDHERLERARRTSTRSPSSAPVHDRHDARLLLVPARLRRRRARSSSTASASRARAAPGRRSREDPLAAEMMGMPVNRLKLMAFSFGAGDRGARREHLRGRADRRVPAELRHRRC